MYFKVLGRQRRHYLGIMTNVGSFLEVANKKSGASNAPDSSLFCPYIPDRRIRTVNVRTADGLVSDDLEVVIFSLGQPRFGIAYLGIALQGRNL